LYAPLPETLRLANLEVKSDRTFVTLSRLKLHGVALIKILDLNARREAATMKEYILTAVVWSDETKSLLPNDFFDRSSHNSIPLFVFCISRLKNAFIESAA